MAKFIFGVEGDDITTNAPFITSGDDAARIIAYGMRRFGTEDLPTVVQRFAESFMGNLTADAIADEQRIASAQAAAAVPPITATPE